MPLYVIVYRSYKFLRKVRFFGRPCIYVQTSSTVNKLLILIFFHENSNLHVKKIRSGFYLLGYKDSLCSWLQKLQHEVVFYVDICNLSSLNKIYHSSLNTIQINPPRRSYATGVLFVCLSVCLSVSWMTHERVHGCQPNTVGVANG